jgi:hypothetical protein
MSHYTVPFDKHIKLEAAKEMEGNWKNLVDKINGLITDAVDRR